MKRPRGFIMKRPSGYVTIGIVVGLFTATLIGLSVASYVKNRKSMAKTIAVSKPPRLHG